MRLKLNAPYMITFILLLLVMMELHEIVHITVGRLICGCWGTRDFNVWELCSTCRHESLSWMATLSGPIMSFALMWLGMFWLESTNLNKAALGFALIFSNIPFGRITTVMMGGGDEMVVTKFFLKDNFSRTEMIMVGTALVLLFGVPPIIKAYRVLTNNRAWLYIIAFLTLPLLFLLVYTLIGLNTLLAKGFLAAPWIMGSPLFITLHTALAVILLGICFRNLFSFNR